MAKLHTFLFVRGPGCCKLHVIDKISQWLPAIVNPLLEDCSSREADVSQRTAKCAPDFECASISGCFRLVLGASKAQLDLIGDLILP